MCSKNKTMLMHYLLLKLECCLDFILKLLKSVLVVNHKYQKKTQIKVYIRSTIIHFKINYRAV